MATLNCRELSGASDADWPQSPQAELARRILPEYRRRGTVDFVANADVVVRLWRAGDQVLPVVERKSGTPAATADVCSLWSHYVRYPLGEIDRRRRGISALARRGLLYASVPFLRLSRIDDAITVNNWLLTTNPPVALDRAVVDELTADLCATFPHQAIVFRTVNPDTNSDLVSHLDGCGYRLVASRTVYLIDPRSQAYRRSENVRRDRKLLHDGQYQVVAHDEFTASDMPRLAELHRLLYIDKHSELNAQLSPLFFETAWRNRFFEFRALRREGRLDAYVAFFELHGLMTGALAGYDTTLPETRGLYRRAVALIMQESWRTGLRLNISAGAGAFKHHRGGRPSIEYDAVFDRHLPRSRRLGWRVLKAAGFLQRRKVQRGW